MVCIVILSVQFRWKGNICTAHRTFTRILNTQMNLIWHLLYNRKFLYIDSTRHLIPIWIWIHPLHHVGPQILLQSKQSTSRTIRTSTIINHFGEKPILCKPLPQLLNNKKWLTPFSSSPTIYQSFFL